MGGRASGSPTSGPELLALRGRETPLGGGPLPEPHPQGSPGASQVLPKALPGGVLAPWD